MQRSGAETHIGKTGVTVEPPADEIEHIHELREDDGFGPWAFLAHHDQLLSQSLDLRRSCKLSEINAT